MRDPVFHIEEVQGVTTLEDYQRDICRAIIENERVAVAACHDLGKTYIESKIALWFLSTFPNSRVITTAPTFNQVKNVLWAEIRAGHRNSKFPLGGVMLQTQWTIDSDWFAIGFSPQKGAGASEGQGTASSFQGFHAEHILVLFDEATGIPKSIWEQAEGMLTSGFVRFVAIGNPTSKASEFHACFQSAAWKKIHLSCFDSPNLKANGITDLAKLIAELDALRELSDDDQQARLRSYKIVQPKLLSTSWVLAMALKWGIDHPLFVSKVLGQFPDEEDAVLMPLGLVEMAQAREPEFSETDTYSIGVDVARMGSDKSVITTMRGAAVLRSKTLVKKEGTEVAGAVIAEVREILSDPTIAPRRLSIAIDGTGVGSGVLDPLNQSQREGVISQDITILEVHFGAGLDTDEDKKLYFNLKAKLFHVLSTDLKKNMCLTQDSSYLEELPTILYRFNSKGQYVIESKDEYKKRTGRGSPDHADSLALANFARYPNQKRGVFHKQPTGKRTMVPGLRGGNSW